MTIAAVSAIALAAPAVSQTANVDANAGVTARVDQLQARIDRLREWAARGSQ